MKNPYNSNKYQSRYNKQKHECYFWLISNFIIWCLFRIKITVRRRVTGILDSSCGHGGQSLSIFSHFTFFASPCAIWLNCKQLAFSSLLLTDTGIFTHRFFDEQLWEKCLLRSIKHFIGSTHNYFIFHYIFLVFFWYSYSTLKNIK